MSTGIAVIDDPACRELLHDLLCEEGYAVHPFPHSATPPRCLRDLGPRRSFWTCAWRTPQPAETSWRTCGTTPCSTRRRAWRAHLIGAPCRSAPPIRRGRGARSWPTPSTWTSCWFCCSDWHVERPQHLLPLQALGDARSFVRKTTSPGRARPGDTMIHERWRVEETAARLGARDADASLQRRRH
jgi:hypothetical protein